MARARDSVLIAFGVLLGVLINCYMTHAKTYIVGGEYGWDSIIDMETWPNGKKFYAGDILAFNYDTQLHNVVIVDQKGHDLCTITEGARVYDSGHDKIQLVFGANYFIDSYPDQCPLGTKMAINATAPPPPPPRQ